MEDDGHLEILLASLDSAVTADKRVAALQSIQSYLDEAEQISDSDQLTALLKSQLKNQNHLVSSLALSIIPIYASKIVSLSLNHSKSQNVKNLLQSVLSIVIERLGDQKEKIREVAKVAIVEMASAAFVVSPPGGSALTKDAHSAAALFEKILKEIGLSAKSAKIKEQVS